MKAIAYIAAVLVAILNISLHYYGKNATGDLGQRIVSQEFLRAFLLGSVSLIGIFAFYRYAGEDMARGIVLMGSVSIIGGTMYAIYKREGYISSSQWLDWTLVGLLALIFLMRAFVAFNKRS